MLTSVTGCRPFFGNLARIYFCRGSFSSLGCLKIEICKTSDREDVEIYLPEERYGLVLVPRGLQREVAELQLTLPPRPVCCTWHPNVRVGAKYSKAADSAADDLASTRDLHAAIPPGWHPVGLTCSWNFCGRTLCRGPLSDGQSFVVVRRDKCVYCVIK